MTASELQTPTRPHLSNWTLFKSIVPYTLKYRAPLTLVGFILVPLAIAGALQPVLIGQAISLLKGEPTFAFLRERPVGTGLNILSTLLFLTIVIRFGAQAFQGFIVQKVGQQVTADIRQDLFAHVLSLAVRFFDRTPVGKLITRLTSDVEALGLSLIHI